MDPSSVTKNESVLKHGFILIVDDSPAHLSLLKYFLEGHNYKVISALGAIEALALIEEITPSLIITDVVMPQMNGYEFCKHIKSNKSTKDVPVILLTVLSNSDDIMNGLACGADNFISKPYSEKYLISLVEKTIEKNEEKQLSNPEISLEVSLNGGTQIISVDPAKILTLIISAYESAIMKNSELTFAQSELRMMNNHLGELVEKRTAELSKINSEKDKFFSIIAHDLRSPFQGLMGMTEVFAKDAGHFNRSEIIEISKGINESATNIYKLVENLLDWAQMQKGAISFTPEILNLYDIACREVDLINERASHKGISVSNRIPIDIKVLADEKMITSVIRNLLSNAVKFTTRGEQIILDAKHSENNLIEVSVTDNGVGMSQELSKKLFKLDEKVGRYGTDGQKSTGLGLMLCKEFVEKNNGTIWFTSEELKGTTFYFTLPGDSRK